MRSLIKVMLWMPKQWLSSMLLIGYSLNLLGLTMSSILMLLMQDWELLGNNGYHTATVNREVQKFSRNMMALAQAVHPTLVWVHVHAHRGQPDNEMVDCVAFALTHRCDIPCKPPWRLAPLLRHPLVDWAWIEVAPTVEIPGLVDLLRIQPADRCLRHEYLDIRQSRRQADDSKQVKWKFVTVNVRTMEYGWGHLFT